MLLCRASSTEACVPCRAQCQCRWRLQWQQQQQQQQQVGHVLCCVCYVVIEDDVYLQGSATVAALDAAERAAGVAGMVE